MMISGDNKHRSKSKVQIKKKTNKGKANTIIEVGSGGLEECVSSVIPTVCSLSYSGITGKNPSTIMQIIMA